MMVRGLRTKALRICPRMAITIISMMIMITTILQCTHILITITRTTKIIDIINGLTEEIVSKDVIEGFAAGLAMNAVLLMEDLGAVDTVASSMVDNMVDVEGNSVIILCQED
jgi:hypothetical protein